MPQNAAKYGRQRPKKQPPMIGLSALRRSHHMTLAQLIERITEDTGRVYTAGAISAVENGHRGASDRMLADLAGVFGLDADDLTTDYAPRRRDLEAAS